jgi:hypothetical protein
MAAIHGGGATPRDVAAAIAQNDSAIHPDRMSRRRPVGFGVNTRPAPITIQMKTAAGNQVRMRVNSGTEQ